MGAHDDPRLDDATRVAAARAGCSHSWNLLIEHHYQAVLSYLRHETGDPDLAADLTQETFLDAFNYIGQLHDVHHFSGWLHRIAHNNLITARRHTAHPTVALESLSPRVQSHIPALVQSDTTSRYEMRELLQQALDGMSPRLRAVLALHLLRELPSREVASELGISPTTARQRIKRGKEELARAIRPTTK